ncbi:MAG TPA: TonB-dependent receptor plug domain-containing protein [Flavobacterium sp.]|nr:TonB-dependent receptor plug domain-containing protein [Flavobacterium sp.]
MKGRLTLFLFFSFLPLLRAQVQLPLRDVLLSIEKQQHIHFSFLEEDIASVSIVPPPPSLSGPQLLQYLEAQTSLRFEIVVEGYVSISVKVDDNPSLAPVRLGEVAVRNILTTGISRKQEGVFVIKPDKMGMLPGLTETDILQAMQQIPGIYSANDLVSDLNIRGGTHDQNLFLWNGIRMFQTGHFFGQISAFNPNLNNRIEITRNGSSAFYGNAVSGTVSIQSLPERNREYETSVSSNLISAEANTQVKLSERASIRVSARRAITDLVRSPAYKSYFDRVFQNTVVTRPAENETVTYTADEDFYFYDASLQYDQRVGERSRLGVSLIAMDNALQLMENTANGTAATAKNSDLSQQTMGAIGSWQTRWSDAQASKAEVYYSYFDVDSKNEKVDNTQVFTQNNRVQDFGIRLEQRVRLSDNLSLAGGYQHFRTAICNADAVNQPEYSRTVNSYLQEHAAIGEAAWEWGRLRTKGGLRLNYMEQLAAFRVEPRLAFQYVLSNRWSMSLLAERKSQTISQMVERQQDFLGIEKRRWVLSNGGSIPIQKSTQAELGFAYNDNKWLVTFDNFYKKVSGITTESQSFQNQLELIRITGSYAVWGSELLVQRDFPGFRTWMSYSFNHNLYDFPLHFPPEFDNNFEIEHLVNFAGIATLGKFKASIGGKWSSGRPYTEPLSETLEPGQNQIAYGTPNGARLPSVLQLNFSASYQWVWEKGRLSAQFALLNLFNSHNPLKRYYRIDRNDNTVEKVDLFAIARTPNFSLRYEF